MAKYTRRLPKAYFEAGVDEFWLADARGAELMFQIHRRGESGYEVGSAEADGFQASGVFGCGFRLVAQRDSKGNWAFDLLEKAP